MTGVQTCALPILFEYDAGKGGFQQQPMWLKGEVVDGAAGNMHGRLFCGLADLEQLQPAELQAPARVQGQTRYQVLADDIARMTAAYLQHQMLTRRDQLMAEQAFHQAA